MALPDIIQARIDAGYGIAAKVLGHDCEQYRPFDSGPPLRLINLVATLPAVFDARPALSFKIPAVSGDFTRYALVDGAAVEVGDYLVGAETVYVASKPPLSPIPCVACNTTVSLSRAVPSVAFGAVSGRDSDSAADRSIWTDWPCSLLYAGKGSDDTAVLPGDHTPASYTVLLPVVPGADAPHSGDVLIDARGQRFSVAWVENSPIGYRLVAQLMTAD